MKRLFGAFLLIIALVSPVEAALQTYAGTFTLTSGTDNQTVSGIVDKDGNAFTPKVIIAWGDRNTSEATFSSHSNGFFGVAVDRATDQQSMIAWQSEDNQAARDADRFKHVTAFIGIPNIGAGTYALTAAIVSMSSGEFVIDKVTNDDSNLPIVKYLAIGGSDLEDAFLQELAIPTAIGSEVYAGFPWEGNLAIFFGQEFGTAGTQVSTGPAINFGVAKDSSNEAAFSVKTTNGSTATNTVESYISNDKCVARFTGATGNVQITADFTAWTSDGFELNFSGVPASTQYLFALVLKGTFQSHIGVQARPTSDTTQEITTTFAPIGGLILGTFATALNTETEESHIILGAFDKTRNQGKWWGDDNTINTDTNMYSSATNVYTQATNPSTVDAQAAVSATGSTSFTLNWTESDANARLFIDLALGSAASTRRPIPAMVLQ